MKKNKTIKAKKEMGFGYCPEGKDPTYCQYCTRIRFIKATQKDERSRNLHGLKS